ncbi:MAG: hypothetical protein IKS68_01195, partial [Mailhella sp.]|nr:hypothetical protein [Mailhella sp.]
MTVFGSRRAPPFPMHPAFTPGRRVRFVTQPVRRRKHEAEGMERPDPAAIPETPGVYVYKDAGGHII